MTLYQRERLEALSGAVSTLHTAMHQFLGSLPKDAGDKDKRAALLNALGRTLAALVLLKGGEPR